MERMSLQELRSVLKSIERALECSVCLECIRGSATICQNGHGVCKPCANQLRQCPQCRTSFSSINPSMLNSVIRLMPQTCKYENNGCDATLMPSDGGTHERLCGYRDALCWLNNCGWVGLVNDTLNHLQCEHNSVPVYTAENRVCKWPAIQMKEGYETFIPVYAFGCVIWARALVTYSLDLSITFHLVPNMKVLKLLAVVAFKRGEFEFTNTIPILEKKAYESFPKQERIVLSNARFKMFSTTSGELLHSLKIVKDV